MAGGYVEIYAQIAVNMADDPKVRALARFGRSARSARDLYVQMVLYCKKTLSDGFVPDEQVGVLVYPDPPSVGAREADHLAGVGLIERCPDGWRVLAFLRRNKSRATVAAEVAERSEAASESGIRGNHERWHVGKKLSPKCPLCVPIGSPTRSPPDPDPIAPESPTRSGTRVGSDRTETETETETRTGLLTESVTARRIAPPTTRGSRLPDDFEPTPEMIEWVKANAPNVGRVDHEAFRDYWRAQPGQRGAKLDWPATWRNWMRREQQRRGNGTRTSANGVGPRGSTTDQRVAAGLALAAELEAQDQDQADPKELTA